jgi:hypothetical protein
MSQVAGDLTYKSDNNVAFASQNLSLWTRMGSDRDDQIASGLRT